MREYWHDQLLEVVGRAEFAALEKSPSLRRALQHQQPPRANAERELFRAARALDVSPGGRFSANTQSRHSADQTNLRA